MENVDNNISGSDINFNELSTRNEVITKYLWSLRQIKTWAEINCQITAHKFDNYLFLQYFQRNQSSNNRINNNTNSNVNGNGNRDRGGGNNDNNNSSYYGVHNISNNIFLLKDEIFKHILDRKRKLLFWFIYLIIACFFISYKNEASTIILRNIQTFIYPFMKLWRKLTLPVINNFPGLTELYDESCLLMNPFFRVDDLSCEPCSNVVNVMDLTHINTAQKTEFVPFIFKINQDAVHVSDIHDLYENDRDVFQRDAYRVKSTNRDVTNLDELFADFNRTHQIESHNLWRCNRMPPARLLRRLFIRPNRLLPTTGIALERYLTIDTPKASIYIIPDAECSNMYIQQVLGTRIIVLRPTVECRHKCRTISIRLPQSFVLSYNWWYWRPISVPDQITNSNSISLIGSYC